MILIFGTWNRQFFRAKMIAYKSDDIWKLSYIGLYGDMDDLESSTKVISILNERGIKCNLEYKNPEAMLGIRCYSIKFETLEDENKAITEFGCDDWIGKDFSRLPEYYSTDLGMSISELRKRYG